MNKLIAELEAYCSFKLEGKGLKSNGEYSKGLLKGHDNATDDVQKILSRHAAKVEEPLAVLADRNGYFISWADGGSGRKVWTGKWENRKYQWLLCIEKDHDGDEALHFWGDTYAECEDKARQYLNTLKDKGEKGD